jgi:hypothetical protein
MLHRRALLAHIPLQAIWGQRRSHQWTHTRAILTNRTFIRNRIKDKPRIADRRLQTAMKRLPGERKSAWRPREVLFALLVVSAALVIALRSIAFLPEPLGENSPAELYSEERARSLLSSLQTKVGMSMFPTFRH